MIYPLMLLIVVLAYLYGCFSTARVITKSFRSLDIYKVGTGLADTENIYTFVSRPLGVLVGLLDIAKAYLFLQVAQILLNWVDGQGLLAGAELLYNRNIMLIYGLAMLLGHTLPITHKLRGGRGIFTYCGVIAFFAFYPMLVTMLLAWLIVMFFKQIRFSQYLIVILPVILTQVMKSFFPQLLGEMPDYFITIMLGIALIMGVLNYIVSKKLGEL